MAPFNTALFAAWLLLMQAFWQAKPPAEWNDIELAKFLADSPWAQMVTGPAAKAQSAPAIQVYLASASAIEKAVAERTRRVDLRRHIDPHAPPGPLQEEFAAWFAENRPGHIIVAARTGNNNGFSTESETRQMERESTMELGGAKVKLSSYFPPTANDPYLYLAFPREPVPAGDKASLTFNLYLPGVPLPFRTLDFKIKDLLADGKPDL